METTAKRLSFSISSSTLHLLAMAFMLLDHLWATVVPGQNWLTCIGRLAFPIFAFLTVEGYFHTHNFKTYLKRLLFFALLSEIPFNLMYGASMIYPFHQNVLWTFLIALLGLGLIDHSKRRLNRWASIPVIGLIILFCAVIGQIAMVDYFAAGVLTVFVFYFFHDRKWWCFLGQLVGLYLINVHLLGSMYYPIDFFGMELHLVQQGLALFALIPIWLYRGRQGFHTKPFQYFCYAFYPAHIVVLLCIIAIGGIFA